MPRSFSRLLVPVLFFACGWGLNRPTLHYDFVYDDYPLVVEKPSLREGSLRDFLSTRHRGLGRHVTALTLELDRRDPLSPYPFHRDNVLLAIASAAMLYALGLCLGIRPLGAGLGALIFLLHPVHTEAIVNIAGRSELLAALGVLSVLTMHVNGTTSTGAGMVATAVISFLALASKENAACLPLLMVIFDFLRRRHEGRQPAARPYVAWGLGALLWLVLVYPNLASIDPIEYVDNPLAALPALERVPKAVAVLGRYLFALLWPLNLASDHSYAALDIGSSEAALTTLALALSSVLLLTKPAERAIGRANVFLLLFFPAAFVVTANVVFPIGTIMAERLVFLPSAGPCLLAGVAATTFARGSRLRRVLAYGFCGVLLLALALGYNARARTWAGPEHFHRMAVVDSPRSAKAHYNLGLYLARQGSLEEATMSLERAVAIHPGFARATYYLASVYRERGMAAQAIATYQRYLAGNPYDSGALSQLVSLLLAERRYAEALQRARALVLSEPTNVDYRRTLVTVEDLVPTSSLNP